MLAQSIIPKLLHARRKQFRVGPAKIGPSASLKCTVGSFLEKINEKMNRTYSENCMCLAAN